MSTTVTPGMLAPTMPLEPVKGVALRRPSLALARLEATRAQLRAVMIVPPPASAQGADGSTGSASGMPWRRWWRSLRQALPKGPVTDLIGSLAQNWWRRHPWRPVAELMAQEARGQLLPFVRRHPLAVVTGAAAVGAATAVLLHWRWRDLRRPMRAAPMQAGSWLARQLAQPALQATLLMKLMDWIQRATPADVSPAPPGKAAGSAPDPSPRNEDLDDRAK